MLESSVAAGARRELLRAPCQAVNATQYVLEVRCSKQGEMRKLNEVSSYASRSMCYILHGLLITPTPLLCRCASSPWMILTGLRSRHEQVNAGTSRLADRCAACMQLQLLPPCVLIWPPPWHGREAAAGGFWAGAFGRTGQPRHCTCAAPNIRHGHLCSPPPAGSVSAALSTAGLVEEEVFENERWVSLKGWSARNLQPGDPGHFQYGRRMYEEIPQARNPFGMPVQILLGYTGGRRMREGVLQSRGMFWGSV